MIFALLCTVSAALAAGIDAPHGLMVDLKPSPSMGVGVGAGADGNLPPRFDFIVPHLGACRDDTGAVLSSVAPPPVDQLSVAYQVQVQPLQRFNSFSEEGGSAIVAEQLSWDSGKVFVPGATDRDGARSDVNREQIFRVLRYGDGGNGNGNGDGNGTPARPLSAGSPYSWRVRAWVTPHCASAWSEPATFVPAAVHAPASAAQSVSAGAPVPSGFSNASRPIWAKDARFAFLRRVVNLDADPARKGVAHATVFVAAAQDGPIEKLLGAYRLHVNGAAVGIGPGRGETNVKEKNHTMYDAFDVTSAAQAVCGGQGQGQGGGALLLALQCYHHDGTGQVVLELRIRYGDGTDMVVGTDDSWRALDATPMFNPSTKMASGGYAQPLENMDATSAAYGAAGQGFGWRDDVGFDDGAWSAAAEQPSFGYALRAKPTQPLQLLTGVAPARIVTLSPTHYFVDMGSEFMGGFRIEMTASQFRQALHSLRATRTGARTQQLAEPEGVLLKLKMSEELCNSPDSECSGGNYTVKVPMRTGNDFENSWTLPAVNDSVWAQRDGAGGVTVAFEHHEYMTFRYAEIEITAPPAPAPPSHNSNTCQRIAPAKDEGQKVTFQCPASPDAQQIIKSVTFASYGTPTGVCNADGTNSFAVNGSCHAAQSAAVVEKLCVGKPSCSFSANNDVFGADPCHLVYKGFSGAVTCAKPTHADDHDHAQRRLERPQQEAAQLKPVAIVHGNAQASLPFKISAWVVRYPWVEGESSFDSPNAMLNAVWELCSNTLKVTSLDTTTDSNTRERLPYEADGQITGASRAVLQRNAMGWNTHSWRHNFVNPTWPTEWRQVMPLVSYQDYLATGDAGLAAQFWDYLLDSTQVGCVSKSTGLVDFSGGCKRSCATGPYPLSSCRDIVDWPSSQRDGYQFTDINTVVNAYTIGGLDAMAKLANVSGHADAEPGLRAKASSLRAAMNAKVWGAGGTNLSYADGLDPKKPGAPACDHAAFHSAAFPLFFDVADSAEKRAAMLQHLRTKRMAGSVYAAYGFLLGLYHSTGDHGAFALDIMTTCDTNSWCSMLKAGATAVMEAWTRPEKPNLSWSHPWASAPASAIINGLMGITATAPGGRRFDVRPQPGNLTWATARTPLLAGFVDASFNQTSTSFKLTLATPANALARVCLPTLGDDKDLTLLLDAKPVSGALDGDYVCIDGVGSASSPRIIERSAGAA